MMKYSTILLLLLLIGCYSPEESTVEETFLTPDFVTEMHPVDDAGVSTDVSLNVIQGIAHFENGWFVTQKSGTSILLINYLDNNGVSLFHKRLNVNSHGQDLSIEQIADNELVLYTTYGTFGSVRNTGVLKLQVNLPEKINGSRDWVATDIIVDSTYNLDYTNATPTLDESKNNFAIRSKNTILIHHKTELMNNDFSPVNHFELNNAQLRDQANFSMWFQGIAMQNEKIYCLTGNERTDTEKKLYCYDLSGITLSKNYFTTDSFTQDFYDKFEPEGLAIVDNSLYFTVMTKDETQPGNVKYLYKTALP